MLTDFSWIGSLVGWVHRQSFKNLLNNLSISLGKIGVNTSKSIFEAQFPRPFRLGLRSLLKTLSAGEIEIPEWLNPISLSGFMTVDQYGKKSNPYHPLEVQFVPSAVKFGFIAKLKLFSVVKAVIEASVDKEEGIEFKGYMRPLVVNEIKIL